MKKWNDPKLITLALLFFFLMILLLAFQGGSGGGDHKHIYVAIGNKDISMARKLKHLKPKTQLLKPINPKKKNEFDQYSDQGSNDLLEGEVFVNLMAKDYQGPKGRKAPAHN